VVVAAGDRGPFVLVAHLNRDSTQVSVGDEISALDAIGQCGISGDSTEPHVHVQVSDSMNWASSQGVPLAFRRPMELPGSSTNLKSFEPETVSTAAA